MNAEPDQQHPGAPSSDSAALTLARVVGWALLVLLILLCSGDGDAGFRYLRL